MLLLQSTYFVFLFSSALFWDCGTFDFCLSPFNLFIMATTAASAQQPTVFPHSHVGFDSITSQIERKLLKRGFQFNVMCVGMCWTINPVNYKNSS